MIRSAEGDVFIDTRHDHCGLSRTVDNMTYKQKCFTSSEGITLIVPVKVSDISYLSGFRACYEEVLRTVPQEALQLLIVDDSPDDIYNTLGDWFANTRATHFRPPSCFKTGANGKLNSIRAALSLAVHDMVLVLDDDFRPTTESLISFKMELMKYDCLKGMVAYISPTITDLINACGIFCVNVTSSQRQFCGHIGFHQNALGAVGFSSSDGLFDELVIERSFRTREMQVGYASNVFLELVTHGRPKFSEQRIRYAYENMAYPFRFARDLLTGPLLLGIAIVLGVKISLVIGFVITLWVTFLCLVGQLKYGTNAYPRWTFLLAFVWYWPYTVCSWLAIGAYLRGGIIFGGRRVRRPV